MQLPNQMSDIRNNTEPVKRHLLKAIMRLDLKRMNPTNNLSLSNTMLLGQHKSKDKQNLIKSSSLSRVQERDRWQDHATVTCVTIPENTSISQSDVRTIRYYNHQ